jgi:hypothetical protein
LVLLDQQDLEKFQSRCALMVFIHYADEHPLYTYAFYSPRTNQESIVPPGLHFPSRIISDAKGTTSSRSDARRGIDGIVQVPFEYEGRRTISAFFQGLVLARSVARIRRSRFGEEISAADVLQYGEASIM